MYLIALFSILDLSISHLVTVNVSWFTLLGGLFNTEEISSNFLGRVSLLPGLHCTTVLSWRKKYNGFLPAAGACGLFAVILVFSLLLVASFQSMDTDGSLEAWICCLKESNNITHSNWTTNQNEDMLKCESYLYVRAGIIINIYTLKKCFKHYWKIQL